MCLLLVAVLLFVLRVDTIDRAKYSILVFMHDATRT